VNLLGPRMHTVAHVFHTVTQRNLVGVMYNGRFI
jgi:hypothetical protein